MIYIYQSTPLKEFQYMISNLAQTKMEDGTVLLFSNSNYPDQESTTHSSSSSSSYSSSSSSSFHNSPQYSTKSSHNLTVTGLSYTIHPPPISFFQLLHKPKPVNILTSVSFVARSCEILAIVGPSGTGKSSLLRIISGRVKDNEFDPNAISINHQKVRSCAQLRKICGFVAQEDNLLPLLTVKETLSYGAKFRLKELSPQEKEETVERLMQELGLTHVADSFVGDEENRGISGGERKRVSIAIDMIQEPPLLLLDEPTSGLDSTSALQVIQLLASMAATKKTTVVLSIHQPSYRILGYLSKFLILSGGSVVFNGSLQLLEKTICNLGFQIPQQLNAVEFAMEIMVILGNSRPKNHISSIREKDSSSSSWPEEEIHEVEVHQQESNNNKHLVCTWCILNWFEIIFLCSRFWKMIYRTKQLFLARTMQALVGGFGLGSVYVKVRKDEAGVEERLSLFAFSLSFLLSSTVEALPIYLQERRVLMKEASRGSYRISSYVIANTVIILPFLFVVAVLFAVPVYWIVGLNHSLSAFIFFTFVVWLIVMMASSVVLFLSAVSPDFISGNSLICTVLGAFFLFSGYFIPKENIPKYWIFMYYVSVYRYPLDSLITNEYWSLKDECFSWRDKRCLLTGNDVLKNRGLERDNRWMNVGIMFGFFVFYRLLCWVILARKASRTTI